MYHLCIFTNQNHQKFIVIGGISEEDILVKLQQVTTRSKAHEHFEKIVLLKSYLDINEGEAFCKRIKIWEQKELKALVESENNSYTDLRKHLPQ